MYRFGQSSRFELHLPAWKKVSFSICFVSAHRSSDKTFDPSDHIFISRRTEKNCIPIIYYAFLPHSHRSSRHEELPVFPAIHFLRIRLLENVSKDLCAIFPRSSASNYILPGLKAAVRNLKMSICTRRKFFQSCHTDAISITIKFFCQFRCKPRICLCRKPAFKILSISFYFFRLFETMYTTLSTHYPARDAAANSFATFSIPLFG